MNTEQVKKWWRLPNTDRLIDVSREQPDGCWESEESVGRCHYDTETAAIHFGESMVYGAHHHYPCGKPDVDADMLREIEDRKVQWKAMWESAEDFPWPVSKIYLGKTLVWDRDEKELRFRDKSLVLSNQAIIEFAYLTMDMIERVYMEKLFFEDANCYTHCYYTVRSLLKSVDPEYLAEHSRISEFYQEGRELSNDWDRLHFEGRTKDDCLECADKPMCDVGQAFCRWPFNRRITNDDFILGIEDEVVL